MIRTAFALALAAAVASADPVTWIDEDSDKAITSAKAAGKYLLVYWKDDSDACRKLEAEAHASPEFQALAAGFVNVRLTEGKPASHIDPYFISHCPFTALIGPNGRGVARIEGYRPASEYVALLRQALENGKALAAAEATLEKEPKDVAARLAAGRALAAGGEYASALRHFDAAREADPANVEAWWGSAEANLSTEPPDSAAARAAMTKILELDPKNEKGRNDDVAVKLARLNMNLNPAGAKADLAKALQDFPGSNAAPEALFLTAAILANSDRDFAGAAAQLEKLRTDFPDSEWARRVPAALRQLEKMKGSPK